MTTTLESPDQLAAALDERGDVLSRQAASVLREQHLALEAACQLTTTPNHEADAVRVKPLEWEEPTDHPQDDDENCAIMAHGLGGRYSISREQSVGPRYLLWMADDEFTWHGYASEEEARDAAQSDYEQRILSVLTDTPLPPASRDGIRRLAQSLRNAKEFIEGSAFNIPTKDYFDAVLKDIDAALLPTPAPAAREPETDLSTLIRASRDWFNSLTPEEQEAHLREQRESWARGEMAIGNDADEARERDSLSVSVADLSDDLRGESMRARAAESALRQASARIVEMEGALKEAEGELYQVPPKDTEQERVLAIVRAALRSQSEETR